MAASKPNIAAETEYGRRGLEAEVILEIEVGAWACVRVEPRVGLEVGDECAKQNAGLLLVRNRLGDGCELHQRRCRNDA
jgi:hypothetical protein